MPYSTYFGYIFHKDAKQWSNCCGGIKQPLVCGLLITFCQIYSRFDIFGLNIYLCCLHKTLPLIPGISRLWYQSWYFSLIIPFVLSAPGFNLKYCWSILVLIYVESNSNQHWYGSLSNQHWYGSLDISTIEI